MLDAEVFLVSQIDEPVITSPTIGMNDAFKVYTSTYDALESGSGAVRNDFRIDVIIAFEQAENNGFSACSTASDAPDPASAEVAFINLDFPFDGRLRLAITGNSFPESRHIPVDGVSVNTGQFRNLLRCQINGKKIHKMTNFCL